MFGRSQEPVVEAAIPLATDTLEVEAASEPWRCSGSRSGPREQFIHLPQSVIVGPAVEAPGGSPPRRSDSMILSVSPMPALLMMGSPTARYSAIFVGEDAAAE